MGGAVVPCWHWKPLTACPTLLLASFRAEGHDVGARADAAFFAAAGTRVGAEIPMSSTIWGFLRAEALVNLTRHQLVFGNEPFWKAPAVGITLSAGALVTIL
jgi:hypothetical protein